MQLLSFMFLTSYIHCSQPNDAHTQTPPLQRSDSCRDYLAYNLTHTAKVCKICGVSAQTFKITTHADPVRFYCFKHYPTIEENCTLEEK